MATVTLNGVVYDSDDLADYGYLNDTVGFFAILVAMVEELAAADTILSLTATTANAFPVANGAEWEAKDISSNDQIFLAGQVYG